MTSNTLKIVETFIIITFPIAVFILCAGESRAQGNGSAMVYENVGSAINASKAAEILSQFEQPGFAGLISDIVSEPTKELRNMVAVEIGVPSTNILRFASNQHQVKSEDFGVLQQHAMFLLLNPHLILTVAGHADQQGSAQYNRKLSERRAKAVLNLLLKYGAPPRQIIVDYYGDTVLAGNGRRSQENRRVELEYSSRRLFNQGLPNKTAMNL